MQSKRFMRVLPVVPDHGDNRLPGEQSGLIEDADSHAAAKLCARPGSWWGRKGLVNWS